MANLVEDTEWTPGIYQLEEGDLVLGGPDGIDNLQAKQLANRTAYLKALVEALALGKQPLDDTLTAFADLVTAADKLIYSTGADAFATSTLTAFARSLLDDVDAAAARVTLGAAPLASPALTGTPTAPTAAPGTNTTQLATTAFVLANTPSTADKQPLDATLTALAALVTAADKLIYSTGADAFATSTLTAFARTLLDDADAAAARTTLGAAPLASPALTGTPTAPTAAAATNTTQLATTAFVQAAIAALVGAAPGALDQLNELATALGNDPNFATTITNALATKQPLDATLTALAALATAADKLIYSTGADAFATSALTAFARSLLDDADAATMRATLGLGTAALAGAASDVAAGIVEFATWAETVAGADNSRAVTPAGLLNALLGAGGTSTTDYFKFPYRDKTTGVRRELIIQIGSVGTLTGNNGLDATFPTAFPNAFLGGHVSAVVAADGDGPTVCYRSPTLTGMRINNGTTDTAQSVNYFVFGY